MVYRLILPQWAAEEFPDRRRILEGEFTDEELLAYNEQFYNIHCLPNYPKTYNPKVTVDGTHIDTFEWAFVDFDLKSGTYPDKDSFVAALVDLPPTRIIDSGNGVHAYWRVTDLTPMDFLKLQRRLMRKFKTDEAVAKLFQLMRPPGYVNTKHKDAFKMCEELYTAEVTYTCEELDKLLPPLTREDDEYCTQHYNKTHKLQDDIAKVDDKLPVKFAQLINTSQEVRDIFKGNVDDRSKGDYRLAHIMFAEGFTKGEAMSVLINCPKALARGPTHRYNYANDIANKVWTFENSSADTPALSNSVLDILKRGSAIHGTRFPCWEIYDGTAHGFRLSEVLGLVGGAGSGKTTLALNYFYWFTKRNPDYIHLFVSLEQPEEEIAQRWVKITKGREELHSKVHVLSNYNSDGTYRNLSLSEIETYVIALEKRLETKVGCVVIDHIGVLKKQGKDGEAQGLIDICHYMKAFAKRTNTFLVMQSQTNREKSGIGDVELDKDAAYGTSMFEWYCDYVVTTWQPLKRVYDQASHMTCSAFKYCKIRHKDVTQDKTKEDVVHALMFDPKTERLRQMNEINEKAYEHYSGIANTLRNKDRKREPTRITKIDWVTHSGGGEDGKADNNTRLRRNEKSERVPSG